MTDVKRNAEAYLEDCALGYAVSLSLADRPGGVAEWDAWKATLHDAGARLAAALGNLDAAERAELTALRRFRDGVIALRGEVVAGTTDTGEPVDCALVVETIDALLFFETPATSAKDPAT